MEMVKVYLNLKDGEQQTYQVQISEVIEETVHAVYIHGFSQKCLDADLGACIEFQIEDMKRWMAVYRYSEVWCKPEFGEKTSEIPDETQGLICEKEDGTFVAVLPVVSEKYKCVLGNGEQCIKAKLFSWYEHLVSCDALAFVWAEGKNPYELMEKCAETALKLLGTGGKTRKERRYPELFEYLGWCSWDAFEIRVDEKSLLEKCQELKEKDIPVKWMIIDDMWAEVRDFYGMEYEDRLEMFRLMHSSKLYSFKADPVRFPNGLKHCIEQMKQYGVKVGMWHPTTGYWMGIDPEGEIYKEYKDCLIQTEAGRIVHSPEQEKAYRFYCAFHDYLRESGADFVKIDRQSITRSCYKKLMPVGQAARQYHNAMEASVGQHFDNQMINCMGMASEDMWNRSVSAISRCSDDFQPENRQWFTKHILQCAYNGLLQGQFYYNDWDMWWTDDEQAEKNSILRALSGGPIYVSDTLGRSRAEILKPLVLKDGRILRCDRPGMPSKDCLLTDPTNSGKVFKVQNTSNGCGLLAVFNLDEENEAVTGNISPADIDGLEGNEIAVYEHFSKEMVILQKEEAFEITLKDSDDCKLYVMIPLKNGCGMIGRTDKFVSPATVRYCLDGKAELLEEGPYACIENGILKQVNVYEK